MISDVKKLDSRRGAEMWRGMVEWNSKNVNKKLIYFMFLLLNAFCVDGHHQYWDDYYANAEKNKENHSKEESQQFADKKYVLQNCYPFYNECVDNCARKLDRRYTLKLEYEMVWNTRSYRYFHRECERICEYNNSCDLMHEKLRNIRQRK